RTVVLVMNPGNVNAADEQADCEAGARALGRQTVAAQVRGAAEFDAAFSRLVEQGAEAFMVATDPMLLSERERLAALAIRHAKPAISFVRELATAGLLMTYGASITYLYRQAGISARPHPRRRRRGGSAGHAGAALRDHRQPAHGADARDHDSAGAAAARRRDHRMRRRDFIALAGATAMPPLAPVRAQV